jgi:hypothetical protein
MAMGLTVATVAPAGAHSVESSLSLSVSDNTVRPRQDITFFGRLRTEGHEQRCESGASIKLIRVGSGVVATDVTDAQGEFSFTIDPQPNRGSYFARYGGSGRFGYANRHRCEGDDSRTISIRRAGNDDDDDDDDNHNGGGGNDDGEDNDNGGGGNDNRDDRVSLT